jgi:hypothetical protein
MFVTAQQSTYCLAAIQMCNNKLEHEYKRLFVIDIYAACTRGALYIDCRRIVRKLLQSVRLVCALMLFSSLK